MHGVFMSDRSRNVTNNKNEKEPVFNNKEEDALITESVKKEDVLQDTDNKNLGVENAQTKESPKKSKDITSKTQPNIEVKGTSRIPWGWIISVLIALGIIGAITYGINNMDNTDETTPDTTQTQTMEAEPPHEENEGDEIE